MASSETTPLLQRDDTPPVNPPPRDQNDTETASPRGTFARNLSALDGFALLISIVIGSGVFSSPGPIDANVPSPGAGLLIWLLGGILAWTGALTMAELGTAIPGEGGIQPYLTHIFGEFWGYLAAWSWVVATMPATLAILCIVFVESVYSSLGVNNPAPPITHKLLSVLVLAVVTVLNSISTKTSTRLSGFFVAVKFLTIALLIVAGLVVVVKYSLTGNDIGGVDWRREHWFAARRDSPRPDGRPGHFDWSQVSTWESLGFYSAALYGALWAYSGWDKVSFLLILLTLEKEKLTYSPVRQIMSLLNYATLASSYPCLSTQPFLPLLFVTWRPMQCTTFCCRGSWSQPQTLRLL